MVNQKPETENNSGANSVKNTPVKKVLFLVLLLAVVLTAVNQLIPSSDLNKPINPKTYIELPDRKALPVVTLEQAGKGKVSTATLKGKWHMLLFGYTFCPDVCPVELSTLHKMMGDLRKQLPAEQLPKIVFVSVDPERDSAEMLEKYVKHFDADFIGLTGKQTDLTRLAMPFGISWMKQLNTDTIGKKNNKNYLLSHATTIILVNPDTKVAGLFPAPHTANEMAVAYQKIIQKEAN
ncbi:MAG: SCO family protein [Cocleimonas sp.]|nr:SCO family protein [Cocleimonas sp.]